MENNNDYNIYLTDGTLPDFTTLTDDELTSLAPGLLAIEPRDEVERLQLVTILFKYKHELVRRIRNQNN